jgi:hypothetical protein
MSKKLEAADVVVIFYGVEGRYSYNTEYLHDNRMSKKDILKWLHSKHNNNVVTIIKIFR